MRRAIMAVLGVLIIILMAVLGVLIIILGIPELGIQLLLAAVITIVLKITTAIQDKKRKEDIAKKKKKEKLSEERRKQALLNQQNNLINQYKNSPLVKDVVNTISRGMPSNAPEEIVITNNWIRGSRQGEVFTYDFTANRVHAFETVFIVTHNDIEDELKYVARPQIAMAEALNSFFDNKFIIFDRAKQTYDIDTDSDGDTYTTETYTSDHVKMVLESTLPNKSF